MVSEHALYFQEAGKWAPIARVSFARHSIAWANTWPLEKVGARRNRPSAPQANIPGRSQKARSTPTKPGPIRPIWHIKLSLCLKVPRIQGSFLHRQKACNKMEEDHAHSQLESCFELFFHRF